MSLAIIPVPFYRQPIMQDHLACFAQAKQEAGGRVHYIILVPFHPLSCTPLSPVLHKAKQEAGGRAHYIILVPFYRLPHIRILRGCRKRCRRKRL